MPWKCSYNNKQNSCDFANQLFSVLRVDIQLVIDGKKEFQAALTKSGNQREFISVEISSSKF